MSRRPVARHTPSVPALFLALFPALLTATALAALSLLAPPPALAQALPGVAGPAAATPALGVTRDFRLPAAPLATTLNAIAAQAGLLASVEPALVDGKRAPAVTGRLTVGDALRQALAGSGLQLAMTGSGAISVRGLATVATVAAAGAAAGTTLPTVEVRARYEGATTEHSGSYTTRAVTIGKAEHALREIPQSISVVTRQRLDDQNLTTLGESMRYVTGMRSNPTGTGLDNIESRGFLLNNYLIDGLPAKGGQGIWGNSLMDMGLYDRAEVWRGATGLLEGAGDPAGTINLVRKRAGRDFAVQSATTVGSWNQRRQEVDVTGPLNAEGTLRGRLVGIYDDRDSFVDNVFLKRNTVYGTLEYDFTPATTLSVGIAEQRGSSLAFAGLPLIAGGRNPDLPRNTFVGSVNGEKDDYASRYFAELEHRLDGGGKFKLAANQFVRGTELDRYWGNSFLNPTTRIVTVRGTHQKSREEDRGLDAFLTLPVQVGGLTQEFTVGANYQTYEGGQAQGSFVNFPQNIDRPNVNLTLPYPDIGPAPQTEVEQYGLYTQARIKPIQPLTLVLGGRLAWWNTSDVNAPANAQAIDARFVPTLGAVYDLNEQLSAYGSVNRIFAPQSETFANGGVLPPRTGQQVEAGLKGEFMDQRVNAHVAVFRIRDENRAVTDPANNGFSIAAGQVQSQGLEAEVSGRITPQWDLTAGYAYTDTKYVQATLDLQGQPFNSAFPRHNVSLWTKYRFGAGALERLWIGGGLRAVSSSATTYDKVTWEQGGYAVYALQAGYAISRNVNLTFSANNLFDKTYFERLAGNTSRQTYYGEPRNFTLALRAAF